MTFGFGVGDIIAVVTIAYNLGNACSNASEDFKDISREVATLHLLLQSTQRYLEKQDDHLGSGEAKKLNILVDGCKDVLSELDKTLAKYESLGTDSKRKRDKAKWGLFEHMQSIRARLSSSIATITAFNSTLAK
jgi:hypothetical protein